ncbi:PAXIP1-associated glutamate-rich protein 1-like [Sinocyclocheilus anshuiensis]|uniref:PAXIP1-associated glutamate-rich protein 1-like n=1 Tax=Sinocyclocheilus anshuiensis TaxID=1608454 RepID=UPI0007BAB603|nr:PREDICTED: PAXIP1-associated glutamate-rich protein 1-like [Sinocyclocheilus anshuiensis]
MQEALGVSEEEKTAGKLEEKETERSEEMHEDATAEDDTKGEEGCVEEDGEMSGDWEIPYSDEEMEEPRSWMPPPHEIKRLYQILAKGEPLELKWEPLPRRPPTPARTPSPERDGDASQEPQEDQRKALTPTEFDFDEEQTVTPKNSFLSRRRTPGSSARSAVRREARLDKVLSDMKRHRRMEEQILRTGRDLFKSGKERPAGAEKPSSPESQRERDRDPSTVFSPQQRRY